MEEKEFQPLSVRHRKREPTPLRRESLSTCSTIRLRRVEERYGDEVLGRRSYQRLERSIMPQELANTWPDADLEVVLAE